MTVDWWIPILIVLIIAITAFILSYSEVRFGWYRGLDKPYLYYDGWVYSPIWFIIYGIIIYSWIRMVTDPYMQSVRYRVMIHILFTLQLLFMLGWIITFFYNKDISNSIYYMFLAIVFLVVLILLSLNDPLSLVLLSIYLFWLLYLLYMTWQISMLNPKQ